MEKLVTITVLGLLICTCSGSQDVVKEGRAFGKARGLPRETVPFGLSKQAEKNGNWVVWNGLDNSQNTIASSAPEESIEPPTVPIETNDARPGYVKCSFNGPTTIKLENKDVDLGINAEKPLLEEIVAPGGRPELPVDVELIGNGIGLKELQLRRALRRLNRMRSFETLRRIRAMDALNQLNLGGLYDSYVPFDVLYNIKDSSGIGSLGGSNGVANIRSQAVELSGLRSNLVQPDRGWSVKLEGRGTRASGRRVFADNKAGDSGGSFNLQVKGPRLLSRSSRLRNLGKYREMEDSDGTDKPFGESKVIKYNLRAESPNLETQD